MKRLTICFALLTVMAWPLAADAGAKQASPIQATAAPNLIGVNVVYPNGLVKRPGMAWQAEVTGTSLLANLVVSYVNGWVDLPQSQIDNPQPFGGCPSGPTSCQFAGRDDEAIYSLGFKYIGPSGRHTFTAQAWRQVAGDSQPVFLGQDSQQFCLSNCSG
jgi:hypothetical protein